MEEHGKTTGTALAQLPTSGALTQPQAMHILKLVYPNVPEDEIIRCAIFCRDFGLHPLAREVYIIPFGDKFSMVVGIPASRKLAHNLKGEFSYLDDTPRAATEEEIIKQFGKDSEEAKSNLISVTKLQGEGGNLAIGFGLYPKADKPKGTDKGNSQRNMANIRSERPAMDRLPGKPMPRVDVIDERYTTLPDVGKVDTATGEIIEGQVTELNDTPEEHWCQEHNCAYELKKSKFGEFYAHKQDKGWCNENTKKEPPAVAETAPEPSPEPVPSTISAVDQVWLRETLAIIHWTERTALDWIRAQFNITGEKLIDVCNQMPREDLKKFTDHIQTMRDAA